jgi:hypothetical protein
VAVVAVVLVLLVRGHHVTAGGALHVRGLLQVFLVILS